MYIVAIVYRIARRVGLVCAQLTTSVVERRGHAPMPFRVYAPYSGSALGASSDRYGIPLPPPRDRPEAEPRAVHLFGWSLVGSVGDSNGDRQQTGPRSRGRGAPPVQTAGPTAGERVMSVE